MNQKLVAAIAVILIASLLVGAVLAASIYTQNNPNNASYTSTVNVALTMQVNGTTYAAGTAINWGAIVPDQTRIQTISIQNTGDHPAVVTLIVNDLPTGFTLTWTSNSTTVPPGTTVTAPLTLHTPTTLTEGAYSWNMQTKGVAV